MEDEDGELGCSGRWRPSGTSSVDAPRRERAEDRRWRGGQGGLPGRGGEGTATLKGMNCPLCMCLLLSTPENVPFSTFIRVTAKRVAQCTGLSLSQEAAPGAVVRGAASLDAWQQLGSSATCLAAPGLCFSCCVPALVHLSLQSPHLPLPAPRSGAAPQSLHTAYSHPPSLCSLDASLCVLHPKAPREHLFCWTDPGLWAMRSSQATDSCPGSRLQV